MQHEPKWSWNPYRECLAPSPLNPTVREFHRSVEGYAPTPLVPCPRAADKLGIAALWIKDESARFGLNAFKALGASWAMSRIAASLPCLPDFSTATDGNHGRSVAWMARRMGAAAHIFVPRNTSSARRAWIQAEGAELRVIDGTYDDAVRACAAASAAHGWQVVSDTGYPGYLEIPLLVVAGYSTIFAEYAEQAVERPDAIFVQGGVGALLSAAIHHFGSAPTIVCVEPLDADCLLASITSPGGSPCPSPGAQNSIMQGLNCGEVSLTAWPTVRAGTRLFLAIPDKLVPEAQALLDPLDSGESGAAGVAGLIAACRSPELGRALDLGPRSRVLAINTESRVPPIDIGALPP